MKYIAIHTDNPDFDKNIETLKNAGFNVETAFTKLKMFVVNIKDDEEMKRLKAFDFIQSVEENKTYQLI